MNDAVLGARGGQREQPAQSPEAGVFVLCSRKGKLARVAGQKEKRKDFAEARSRKLYKPLEGFEGRKDKMECAWTMGQPLPQHHRRTSAT